ncbi:hypothetical protein STENM327S_06731 [Streptomyces tendae]
MTWAETERTDRFDTIRTGLFVGAACVLALIGASLLVSQLEQLRERKKLLSALVAFGTRRRTLSMSVLWQTAIPIVLGLLLSMVVGLTLGTVLLKMTSTPVRVDWTGVLSMTGIGAAVVLAVTLCSLPPLLRLMRPQGPAHGVAAPSPRDRTRPPRGGRSVPQSCTVRTGRSAIASRRASASSPKHSAERLRPCAWRGRCGGWGPGR